MTDKIYYEDSYLTHLEASVTAIDEQWVELDKSIFYPMGGGQPGDTGTLHLTATTEKTYRIVATEKSEGLNSIRHQLSETDHGLSIGDSVTIELDWERRYKHMKMHTCMHLLGSLIPVPVTGGSVGAEKSRLDFDIGEHKLDKIELTAQLNKLIDEGHPLIYTSITDAELDANPDLVRTMSVQPPRGSGSIRMVRIDGIDYQPCGGTHLNNTNEIGVVRVSKIENKGKRNRRVHIVFE